MRTPTPTATYPPAPTPAPTPAQTSAPTPAHDLHRRLAADLHVSREALARWQRYADTYERERDDAYRERAHLLAWLAALHRSSAVLAPVTDAPDEDRHRLHLMAGGRWLSWRIAHRDLPLFHHVPYAESARARTRGADGETETTYAHVRRHTHLLALDGAGDPGSDAAGDPRSDDAGRPEAVNARRRGGS
jgi:hypothetical protein